MATVTAASAAGAASRSISVARSTERTGAGRVAAPLGLPADMRPRRTCHAVPGSSERFLAKAPSLEADEVFLDLEDAVAQSEKENARRLVIEALKQRLRRQDRRRARQRHRHAALLPRPDRRRRAGRRPAARDHAAQGPHPRRRRDDRQAADPDRAGARTCGNRIGIEAQIEDATGLLACEAIAAASPRMETLIFGPGDYSAAVGIPITTIGGAPEHYPGDHLNYVFSRLVVAARAAGIQAIDGPYAAFDDDDGLRATRPPGACPRDGRQVDDPPAPDRDRQRGLHARARGMGARRGAARRLQARPPTQAAARRCSRAR